MRMVRIENFKTVEHWAVVDSLTMMRQLGHVPAPGNRESW
jgi:predicted ester cyclase